MSLPLNDNTEDFAVAAVAEDNREASFVAAEEVDSHTPVVVAVAACSRAVEAGAEEAVEVTVGEGGTVVVAGSFPCFGLERGYSIHHAWGFEDCFEVRSSVFLVTSSWQCELLP